MQETHKIIKEKRNAVSVDLRVSPCEICGFPLTHRHHIFGFKLHGENLHTWQLCATCHELLHIALNAIVHKNKRATEVWEAFYKEAGTNEIVKKIEDKVYETAEMVWEMEIAHYGE